jgi:hypothetical protein
MTTLDREPRRSLKTAAAAKYLGVSTALLRKLRLRGSDDPGYPGPEFIKLTPSLIVYEISALDRWLDKHRMPSAEPHSDTRAA